MQEINPVEFGKLINAVETLTGQMSDLTREVDDLRQTLTGGKGVAVGLMVAAGGLGAGLTKFVDHIFK
jgi:hypothetical protein